MASAVNDAARQVAPELAAWRDLVTRSQALDALPTTSDRETDEMDALLMEASRRAWATLDTSREHIALLAEIASYWCFPPDDSMARAAFDDATNLDIPWPGDERAVAHLIRAGIGVATERA